MQRYGLPFMSVKVGHENYCQPFSLNKKVPTIRGTFFNPALAASTFKDSQFKKVFTVASTFSEAALVPDMYSVKLLAFVCFSSFMITVGMRTASRGRPMVNNSSRLDSP
ncbi:hypothetical protein [Emticicia fontis]